MISHHLQVVSLNQQQMISDQDLHLLHIDDLQYCLIERCYRLNQPDLAHF